MTARPQPFPSRSDMQVSDLFRYRNKEIQALHLTWIAFFICFYVWFNMAPLASSMLRWSTG
jgi:MFS transporter, NNP family, nitrate/nitrite transporter